MKSKTRTFLIGVSIGWMMALIVVACATPAPLKITPVIDSQGRRCYSKEDDSAWRERYLAYSTCCLRAAK